MTEVPLVFDDLISHVVSLLSTEGIQLFGKSIRLNNFEGTKTLINLSSSTGIETFSLPINLMDSSKGLILSLEQIAPWMNYIKARLSILDENNQIIKGNLNLLTSQISEQFSELTYFLSGSCKELLEADPTLEGYNGEYLIYQLGSILSVYCDMTTDGGGWTRIHSQDTYTVSYNNCTIDIDDKEFEYNEILIICDVSHYFDYSASSASIDWHFDGINILLNAFKFSGNYYLGKSMQAEYLPIAILFDETDIPRFKYLEDSDFNIISHTSNCYFLNVNKSQYCGNIVAIQVPNGKRLEAVSDLESVLGDFGSNYLNYKFWVYVRK